MKKLIPVLSLLLLLSSCANGAGSFSSASSSLAPDILEAHRKVPVFNFYTNGQVIPDRDDDNYEEYLSSKATYQDPLSYFIDENFKVRVRGTSSRYFDKKGYKLSFSENRKLMTLPSNKKYNLLASYMDPCKLRDYLALRISYSMNTLSDRYASEVLLSKLFIDDQYKGLYFLTDNVAAYGGRIPLDDIGANENQCSFVLEMDTIANRYGVEGKDYFRLGTTDVFDYENKGYADLYYQIDTPKQVSKERFNFIQGYITDCRELLVNKDLDGFKNKVDVDAFIDYFLLCELFRNTDAAGRSVYMYLPTVNGKLIFGPSWDFDYSCSRPFQLGPNQDYRLDNAKDRFYNYDWWKLFLEIDGSVDLIKNRYTSFLRNIFIDEIELSKSFFNTYNALILEDASIWYSSKVNDTEKLVLDNFNWTSTYFSLRMEMTDELFLLK